MSPVAARTHLANRLAPSSSAESTRADGPPSLARVRRLDRLPRFALVMAALLAVAAFPQSALFALDHVDVGGDTRLTQDAVLAIAGVRRGDRLFAINTADAVRRLRGDPRIKTADLWLRPPRGIAAVIVDRRPVVALRIGDRFAWLGDDLVVIDIVADAGTLPEVVDRVATTPWTRVGAPVASAGAKVAVGVLPSIPSSLHEQLLRIVVAAGPDITFVLRSGLEIRVGGRAHAAERLAQVPDILAALRARGMTAAALDLRYAGSVAVRLAPEGEAR